MTMDTAGLVGFGMRQIVKEDHALQPAYKRVYRPGRWWAEPDIDQAAAWLRLLVSLRFVGSTARFWLPR